MILTTLAAIFLWQNRRRKEERRSAAANYRRTALAVGVLCFYALIVNWVGYLLTTFFSFILWLSLIERKAWIQTAFFACLASVAVYAFNVLFSVQLPAGLLKGILR
jgi:membrane-associated HD superfamily phosphohydrolase